MIAQFEHYNYQAGMLYAIGKANKFMLFKLDVLEFWYLAYAEKITHKLNIPISLHHKSWDWINCKF